MLAMRFAGVSLGLTLMRASAGCTDESQYCGAWAKGGECVKNPGYMLARCAKSCGAVCGDEPPTEVSSMTEAASTSVATTPATEIASTSTVVTTSQALGGCHAFDAELDDTDVAGSMLLIWRAAFMDECCSKCDETTGCEGFSYGHGTCYLKGSLSGTWHSPGIKTRLRTQSGDCTGFAEEINNVDLTGQLVQKVYAASQDLCCSACKATVHCQGFSYFEQYCYLKGQVGGTYGKDGCVVQIKQDVRRLSPALVV